MPDPVTLVILVAIGEAANPTTTAMAQGAREAFVGVVAEVHGTPSVPADADAVAAEADSRADAVAELLWSDSDHRHATLRVHLRQSQRWVVRSFAFASSDPAAERGRTLGFAVASILPALPPAPVSTPAPAPPSASAPILASATGSATASTNGSATASTNGSATASTNGSAPAAATGSPAATAPGSSAAPARVLAPSDSSRSASPSLANEDVLHPGAARFGKPRLAIDLLAEGSIGIAGSAGTVGGGAALEWFVVGPLSLRLAASDRAGSLDAAEARMSMFVTSAGIAAYPWEPTRAEPIGVSLRADYLLLRQSVTHFDSDDPRPVTQARWLSGVDTFIDGTWLLSSQIAAVAGVGIEDVWSLTYIDVRGAHVATLPVLRTVAEAGFQLRF